jgi:hypothetical protein
MIVRPGCAAIGLLLLASFPAQASGSRQACLSANYKCELKCQLKGDGARSVEQCLSVCDTALDTCFSFADTLEPPARDPGRKPNSSQRGDAQTGGAILAPD